MKLLPGIRSVACLSLLVELALALFPPTGELPSGKSVAC